MTRERELDGPVLVSACLLGLRCRWDGTECRREEVFRMTRGRPVIPVCPEQQGGLPTPREPAEIQRGDGGDVLDGTGRVIARDGRDITQNYLRGARQALKLGEMFGASRAILKEGSPACGVRRVKRGGQDVEGMGVAAALLARRGVELEGMD